MKSLKATSLFPICLMLAGPAHAADASGVLDSGTTAWMLMAAVLGLMMTVPGIALFYGGMVRRKNMLSIAGQCFAICCLVSVVWILLGYSLAFSGDNEFIGDLGMLFLTNLDMAALRGSFPESLYVVFQLGFGVVAAALITGAVADRMRFSTLLLFIALWSIVVYAPIVHWIWGGGFLKEAGVLDYAGGTIVHINAGIAGLVACLIVGKRTGYGSENMAPHNPLFSVIGVSLLWIGWFGFSAGSSLAAGSNAAFAMLVTQTSAAAGALTWMCYEWWMTGKPSVLGIVSGAVAGLVAITPAAGYVSPAGGLAIGMIAGVTCCWACAWLKYSLGYDDALDVFGIHGVGGLLGAVLTGVFAQEVYGNAPGVIDGNFWQLWVQIEGVLFVAGWSAVGTAAILYLLKALVGLRVTEDEEQEGLDFSQHGEAIGADE
ncbi:MAG: ammonium transporter [Gammaproteobacteria bacterium]|nr:ammonium transporter [Gammaproteobacteria bacterium]